MEKKKRRKGSLLNPDDPALWKIEKQVDAALQHLRIVLSLIRKEIVRVNKAASKLEKGWSSTRALSSDEGSNLKAGLSSGRSGLRVELRPRQPSKKHETSQTCSGERRLPGNADMTLSLHPPQQSIDVCRRKHESSKSSSECNVECMRKPGDAKF